MPAACEVSPVSAFLSTNLNSKIECYESLGERIKRSLGYPLISLEIHQDQLFENIQIGVEMFSKFAGYTREYLIFDSNLYEKNKGIRLDYLFTIANSERTPDQKVSNSPAVPDPNYNITTPNSVFIATSAVASTVFSSSSSLSALFSAGIDQFDILDQTLYSSITRISASPGRLGKKSARLNSP
jgi:hypothetical protein